MYDTGHWELLRIVYPNFQGQLRENAVQEILEVLGDTRARRRSHLLDNLFDVLIQELIHRLADHVVAVQVIVYAKSRSTETEID